MTENWAWLTDSDSRDGFASREEAIAAAPEGSFTVGEAVPATVDYILPHWDNIVQDMIDHAGDDDRGGMFVREDWLQIVPDDAGNRLQNKVDDAIKSWLHEEGFMPDWWHMTDGEVCKK